MGKGIFISSISRFYGEVITQLEKENIFKNELGIHEKKLNNKD